MLKRSKYIVKKFTEMFLKKVAMKFRKDIYVLEMVLDKIWICANSGIQSMLSHR
ncbi:MAG: hypothetical protein JWQ63_3014 [Mucilaginibacter sp.]|nr:hypothetical protein [Mucilaginibacter sp.]